MEKPRDRDFIETAEGLLFCVVGYLHPPERITAYLKYIPAPEGKWGRGETRYSRALPFYHVSQVEETYRILEERYPHYLFDCPVRNIRISSVPWTRVKAYYHPMERLGEIRSSGERDPLEEKAVNLVSLLSDLSGIREGELGVTGSLLTGNHNPKFSDIDLTVYGLEASLRLKEALSKTRERGSRIKPYSRERNEEWSLARTGRFPLSFNELMNIAERRWNYGLYMGTYFSVHPVRTDSEIKETYGERLFRRSGSAWGTAVIKNAEEAMYLPATYHLENVQAESEAEAKVEQIVSYEGMFSGIFEEGENIEFRGSLEKVSGNGGFHRVVVGGAGSGGGYIKQKK